MLPLRYGVKPFREENKHDPLVLGVKSSILTVFRGEMEALTERKLKNMGVSFAPQSR